MLRDDQGRTFSVDNEALGFEYGSQDLPSQLQPGITYKPIIPFDVPSDAKGFTLLLGGNENPLNL